MRFAKRTIASTKLSKRIGWLNNNAGLLQEIRYSEVKDLLTQVGDQEAMKILGQLEDKDRAVRDPTAYLKAAALKILGGSDEAPVGRKAKGRDRGGGEPVDESVLIQKVEKRVQWLNANANLREELLFDDVGMALVNAGQRQAMQILKELEDKAGEVMDPTTFVLEELEKCGGADNEPDDGPAPVGSGGNDGRVGRGSGRRRRKGANGRRGRSVIKTGLKEKPLRNFADQVRRRIEWLNGHADLQQELDFDRVVDLLLQTGQQKEVMKILKNVEENASSVRNPTAYVANAAKNLMRDGPEQPPQPVGLNSKLSKRIGWLNKQAPLAVPIDYDRIAPFLQDLDTQEAMEILRRLEQNAVEIRDPSAYIIAAARRLLDEPIPPPPSQARSAPALPAPPPKSNTAETKLQKRIAWLNSHIDLAAPLDYDRVAPDLLSVDLLTAVEVLNDLEERADTVRDPNAYVVSRARRNGGGGGGGMQGPTPRGGGGERERRRPPPQDLPPPPQTTGEERLVKRIEWLNRNISANHPLDLDEVMPDLLGLKISQAMEVLKKFEESAHEIRNPNAYVVSNARRMDQRGGRPSSVGSSGRTSGGHGPANPWVPGDRGRAPMMALPGAPAMDEKITYYGGVEEKLRKRVDWLTKNVPLAAPLVAPRVLPELLKVKPGLAFEILKKLEDSCHEIRDPSGYVISLARRGFNGGSGSGRRGRGSVKREDDEMSI